MANLSRVLAVLLALMATGIVPTLAAVRSCGEEIGAEHEDAHGACRDCAPDCALCLCCPLRAAPTKGHGLSSAGTAFAERLMLPAERPALRLDGTRIFHPPRV
jgi:hypothetical protein